VKTVSFECGGSHVEERLRKSTRRHEMLGFIGEPEGPNPSKQAAVSKIALFSFADFGWHNARCLP
jgi:hypothetical protein